MQIVLGSLFLLLLSTSHGWQIRDRIGDNELEERIIYPGKRERLIEEMNRLFTHSSRVIFILLCQERYGAGMVTSRPARTS